MKLSPKQPDWAVLQGGYRRPYDPRATVARLSENSLDVQAWSELWAQLHHQGDVGEASYAAVPLIVEACRGGTRDWNFYALLGTIEVERHSRSNPELPAWLEPTYMGSLQEAKLLALSDLSDGSEPLLVRSALAVVALGAGQLELGAVLVHSDAGELAQLLEDWVDWSSKYREATEAG